MFHDPNYKPKLNDILKEELTGCVEKDYPLTRYYSVINTDDNQITLQLISMSGVSLHPFTNPISNVTFEFLKLNKMQVYSCHSTYWNVEKITKDAKGTPFKKCNGCVLIPRFIKLY